MPSPKLSIIMPAYNHEQFVGEAIEGVLNQTFSDFEFIIIDDGSTDATAEVINGYQDERIQYHYQENQDAFNAINNGMAKAQGEYWGILNSDDVYHPERFKTLFDFQKDHKAECLFTDVSPIDDHSQALDDPAFGWNQWHQKNRQKYFDLNDLYAGFLHGNFMVTTSNLFMSAELAKKVGGFSSLRYLHDYDYIFRLMLASPQGCFYLDNQQLMSYRIHGNNTLSEGAILAREQDQMVIRQYLLAVAEQECSAELKKVRIETGLDRLLALEHEMIAVKAELSGQTSAKSGNQHESSLSLKSRLRKAASVLKHGKV